jgi:hypothetical protein
VDWWTGGLVDWWMTNMWTYYYSFQQHCWCITMIILLGGIDIDIDIDIIAKNKTMNKK